MPLFNPMHAAKTMQVHSQQILGFFVLAVSYYPVASGFDLELVGQLLPQAFSFYSNLRHLAGVAEPGGEDEPRGMVTEDESTDDGAGGGGVEGTGRAGYPSSYGGGGGNSLFGFDSIVFGLALATFAAFLVQFIVNLVNAGRRRKREAILDDGESDREHLLETLTRWITPVMTGDLKVIWDDLDPDNEGLLSLVYRNLPDLEYVSDTNAMLTDFAAMGEAMRDSFAANEALLPDNDGQMARDVHRKLCEKYAMDKTINRLNARLSKYYWTTLTSAGFMAWAEPYLRSIGHGLNGNDCNEWPESEPDHGPVFSSPEANNVPGSFSRHTGDETDAPLPAGGDHPGPGDVPPTSSPLSPFPGSPRPEYPDGKI